VKSPIRAIIPSIISEENAPGAMPFTLIPYRAHSTASASVMRFTAAFVIEYSAAHDLTAARIWGIVRRLAAAGLIVLADKGYIGAGEPVITPYRGRNKPPSQKAANRAHAQLRAPAERANAQLKTWHILRKLRCPWRAGQLAKAIHVLQTYEIGG
jgi:hypothetical protein